MLKRGLVAAACLVALPGCVSPQFVEATAQGPTVFPGVTDLALAPGHWIAPQCGLESAKLACVVVGLERDKATADAAWSGYVAELAKSGWVEVWRHEGVAMLRTGAEAPRCLKVSADLWDDGRAARIILKPIVRFELDAAGAICRDAEATAPVHNVIPDHQS